ncbi:AraC family transcriptional regulator [Permianibacter sp. IMCC34836]|nr:AraC family transcriptional regulator [Permianibacter fluminis]
MFNVHDVVLFITVYQCLLFALFLWIFRVRKRGNTLLALFLLCHAAIPADTLILYGAAFQHWAIEVSPNLFFAFGHALWLEAPLLLLYVRTMVYRDYRPRWRDGWLFLPFLFYTLFMLLHYYRLDHASKIAILYGYDSFDDRTYSRYVNLLRELFRLACGVLAYSELWRYQQRIKDVYANIEKIDLTWLRILVLGFLAIRADKVFELFGLVLPVGWQYYIDFEFIGLAANYTVMLLISALIFFSLRFSTVVTGLPEPKPELEEKPVDKLVISPDEIQRLESHMREHKPHLNCLLNLDNLAGQLQWAPRHLSQVINRHYQQNFFDFINTYRIDECKRLLADPSHRGENMLEIMESAGFNSKATFNTFFKKKVGLTPSEYRQQQLASR